MQPTGRAPKCHGYDRGVAFGSADKRSGRVKGVAVWAWKLDGGLNEVNEAMKERKRRAKVWRHPGRDLSGLRDRLGGDSVGSRKKESV